MKETIPTEAIESIIETPVIIHGWGRTPSASASQIALSNVELKDRADYLNRLIAESSADFRLIARGLGRSYGDASLCAGGHFIGPESFDNTFEFDPNTLLLRVSAGVPLDQIMERLIPSGYFVPVTPGTRYVTVGGAIAADIHGKNHHRDGSFIEHVTRLQLVTGTGIMELTPNDPMFWATAGGLGMTGIITEATLKMRPIPTSYMKVTTERTPNLEETVSRMSAKDDQFEYSVAWIDCLAKGESLGRSVITWADHARVTDLSGRRSSHPLQYAPKTRLTAPDIAPNWLLNRLSVKAFNELWFRKAPIHAETIETIPSYFHPLDAVSDWNRLYGKAGFLQYQFQIPFEAQTYLRSILERLSQARASSFLAVLKRFGPSSGGHLSFPAPGWTLALDIPVGTPMISALLDSLDYMVADAGGRIYLAKDSRVAKDLIPTMYRRIDQWRELVNEADPAFRFLSDLGRRLDLRGTSAAKTTSIASLFDITHQRGPNL